MTDLQGHLIQLLKEIGQVCSQRSLPYALFGASAGWANERHAFIGARYELHIMMRAADISSLKAGLAQLAAGQRLIEDMSNNSRLANNYVRYVDTGTTLIDNDDHGRYEGLGAAVTIHPLFSSHPSKLCKRAAEGMVYLGGGEPGGRVSSERRAKRFKQLDSLAKWHVDALLAKLLSRRIASDRGFGPDEHCYYDCDNGNSYGLPGSDLWQTKLIQFEDMEVPVPKQLDSHLAKTLHKPWDPDTAKPLQTANRIAVIVDASTPYEESLRVMKEAGFDLRKQRENLVVYHRWSEAALKYNTALASKDYARALLSRDRIDVCCVLAPKINQLRAAAENEDEAALRDILEDYCGFTKRYLDKGLGFYINGEVFECAKKLWSLQGKKANYSERVLRLVPEAHRNVDLFEYLSAYKDMTY